ncbi:MAG: ArsR/SmtB family transcription factor [Gemmatimonadales bacterium]
MKGLDRAVSRPAAPAGPDRRPVDGPRADRELAALAKALGHPARVRIVRLLARRSSCQCGEIVGEMDLAQSTVSQHLKILKQAGIIQGEIDGPRVCYWLNPRSLRRLRTLLAGL